MQNFCIFRDLKGFISCPCGTCHPPSAAFPVRSREAVQHSSKNVPLEGCRPALLAAIPAGPLPHAGRAPMGHKDNQNALRGAAVGARGAVGSASTPRETHAHGPTLRRAPITDAGPLLGAHRRTKLFISKMRRRKPSTTTTQAKQASRSGG